MMYSPESSPKHLLAYLLGNTPQAHQLASDIIHRFNGVSGLRKADYADLIQVPNLQPTQADYLIALIRFATLMCHKPNTRQPILKSPEAVAKHFMPKMQGLRQEQLRVVMVDANRRLIADQTVYIGNLNQTPIRVAEVFRDPIARNCAGIFLVHNHPSGDPAPSVADLTLTESLIEAGRLLDIPLFDHVILGDGEWVSLRDVGLAF